MNAHSPERNMPALSADIDGISNRLRDLAYADLCGSCEPAASRAVSDIARLIAQIHELYAALAAERLRSANLESAIRAALGAYDDGETDPLAYLRDEIAEITGAAYGA
jgi:predicted DNA-binding ribbon-helix-helix protein